MDKGYVLYVEDEEDDILFMRRAFIQVGLEHSLQFVLDGKQALAFLERNALETAGRPTPHMVLLDLNLPVLSGFEVLTWIRQQEHLQQIPVVIFSSSGRPEDRLKAEELGAAEYVLKPSSGYQFSDVIRDLHRRYFKSVPLRRDSAAA